MEKKVYKFPSIEQFRNVIQQVSHKARYRGEDENEQPIYEDCELPILNYRGAVKLHGCFSKETNVTLANGEEVPICEIEVGDIVLSYDTNSNQYIEKEVTHTQNKELDKDWLELIFDNDIIIRCTADHKFYTKNRGWVEAKDLNGDDIFITNT